MHTCKYVTKIRNMAEDILQEIADEDLPKLRDFYLNHMPYATHVVSFLNTARKWKRSKPNNKYITFFAPNGNWKSHGTFIALMQYSCYDLFVFTMEKSCISLFEGLTKTERINWTREIQFYAVHRDHCDIVKESMKYLNVEIDHSTTTEYWYLTKEKACQLTYECPGDFYIKILTTKDVDIINEVWPHRYPGSEKYLQTFIEMNGGHGVYKKDDNQLVSWCLKNQLGLLGILQTRDDFKRKSLGSLVTKSLSKEIGLEGHNPLGTILVNNIASQNMFRKMGFEVLNQCQYIVTCGTSQA